MLTHVNQICRAVLAAGAIGACLFSPALLAAGTGGSTSGSQADIEARYQTDVARCKAGQTNQDEATCLREAGAALEESRRHRLINPQAGSFDKNAVDRCNALPVSEQQDCLTQMSSPNTTQQGSIQSGGVLRETVIPVPATPPATPPLPSSSMTPASPVMPMAPVAPMNPASPVVPAPAPMVPAPMTPAPMTPAPMTPAR